MDDLVHDARQEACLIRTGIADQSQRGENGENDISVRRCMLQEAVNAGDTEYAKWLAAKLGEPVPEKRSQLDNRQVTIQRAIDQTKAIPNPSPGLQKALEDFRDSFKK